MNMMKTIKGYFANLPIRSKLAVMFTIASFVPLLFISVYSFTQMRNHMLNQAKENISDTNRQINTNTARRIDSYTQVLNLIYTDTMLKGYLTKNYTKSIDYVEAYDYIDSLLYSLLVANSDLSSLSIYIDNDTIPTDAFFIKHIDDIRNTPDWIREVDLYTTRDLFRSTGTDENGTRIFSIGKVLNYSDGNFPYGIVVLNVKESVLYSLIEQENTTKDIYITDAAGQIITCQKKSMISDNLSQILGQPVTELPFGTVIRPIDNIDYVVARNITDNQINTFSLVPVSEILSDTVATTNQIVFVFAASILFAIFLIIRVSRYFSNRFVVLNERVKRLENEDFAICDSTAEVMGNDEIGQLYGAFDRMTLRLNELINQLYKKEISQKEAELQLLQSQINPHFLYNTLGTISSLAIHNDDRETAALVSHLSQFYKTSLNKGRRYISVQRELNITKHYTEIQKKRFPERFHVHWDTDQTTDEYVTLKLLLQPCVENAIHHAPADDNTPVDIVIRCFLRDEQIIYEIEDNGVGMHQEQIERIMQGESQSGYGIQNVRDRLKLAYGEEYDIRIISDNNAGTTVQIVIPAILISSIEFKI